MSHEKLAADAVRLALDVGWLRDDARRGNARGASAVSAFPQVGPEAPMREPLLGARARLAAAITLDLDDGLLDVWRRAADNPAVPLVSPSRFLQALTRVAEGAFSVDVALHLEQGRIARKQAELRCSLLWPGRVPG